MAKREEFCYMLAGTNYVVAKFQAGKIVSIDVYEAKGGFSVHSHLNFRTLREKWEAAKYPAIKRDLEHMADAWGWDWKAW